MPEDQDKRFIGITTPLGTDINLISIRGDESISTLFYYTLELSSEEQIIQPEDIVGKPVDFWVLLQDGTKRNFNGYVSQFVSGKLRADGLRAYQATVVPWFWFLTKTCDHKIFQSKKATDIIEDVFKSYGFTDYKLSLSKVCIERDYCVQYAESSFNFVSRLLEEEGIFYYFTHEQGKHTLVMSDNTNGFQYCDENELTYLDNIADVHLDSWAHHHAYITGKVTGSSYSFEEPNTNLLKEVTTVVDLDDAEIFEHYEYPYGYTKLVDGEDFVKAKIEAEESQYHTVESSGNYRSLTVGGKFTVVRHECPSEEGEEYTIISLRFDASEDVTSTGGSTKHYFNQFVCIPVATPPTPQRLTPRSRVYGMQTAVVVGPNGEEIHTDKYGRVKVQFHWDRIGEKNEKSSCWIRVSQSWAGKGWGGIIIPRIGQEVVVSFLDGNPDKPLITGQVYNAVNMPPYDLPANQSQSGFKTRSTKDGGTATFNELRFEDKKDAEEIYIHAQKDLTTNITKNKTTTITEGDDVYLLKKGNRVKTLEEGDLTTDVNGDSILTASYKIENKVGGNSVTIDTSKIELKVGENSIKIEAAGITLKCGSNTIKMDPSGISLKGMIVKVEANTMTEVKGNAMVKIQGGITMIN